MPQMPINPIVYDWSSAEMVLSPADSLQVYEEPDPFIKIKRSPTIETSTKDWLEKTLVRKAYNLPSPPKQEPAYVEKFIAANKLTFQNPEFPFVDKKGHVGIEVEVENVTHINVNIPLCFWMIEEDGSLRNHGKEFKTFAIPLSNAQMALEQLFSGLNPDVEFSHRTSVHVHVDVRGLTMSQLLTMLFTYATVENLLFKFVGANRRNNIFCTPITETRLFAELDIRNANRLRDHFQTMWQKYSALNLLPIATFGTVEFRQMPGTNDVTKLCVWLDLLSRLKLFAYQNDLTTVLNTISELNTTSQYRKFVESVFGDLTAYLDTSSLLVDMEKAVFLCKNCAAVNDFHQKVLSKVEDNSLLLKVLGKPTSMKQKLGARYPVFMTLYEGGSYHDEKDLYMHIQSRNSSYRTAFPHPEYLDLFSFIKDNPL